MEVRLIDGNALLGKCENLYMRGNVLFHGVTAYAIENAPTIDPKTLPIVQELREQLERVTRERDAARKDLKLCAADLKDCAVENYMECNYCKNKIKKYVSEICRNCKDGSNFEWHSPQKED